ncbi:hypothetical protein AVEN_170305-1 [Araneus ventricosus]|uniref:Uncharacterized protein n=1 Tax=Araneus ventricosus TaxID=182803 RepID=A0A4Y2CBK4_ARAVE|nr:hypothetical protein AVEN_170305-1 [Araneus ventricosus]
MKVFYPEVLGEFKFSFSGLLSCFLLLFLLLFMKGMGSFLFGSFYVAYPKKKMGGPSSKGTNPWYPGIEDNCLALGGRWSVIKYGYFSFWCLRHLFAR